MPRLAENKKARFEYETLETLEVGLVLNGQEVKSVRSGGMNLTGSYVMVHKQEVWLLNAHIAPYPKAGYLPEFDPTHSRKLLLHRRERNRLMGLLQQKGLTIVPLSVYTKGPRIKVEIAVVRGKKAFDKRALIKKREIQRHMRYILKQGDERYR